MKRLVELASRSELKASKMLGMKRSRRSRFSAQGFLDVITTLESQGQFQKAATYMQTLVTPYLDRSKWDEALTVLKRIAKIAPKSSGLRTNLLKVFRGKYAANESIEALIKHSGSISVKTSRRRCNCSRPTSPSRSAATSNTVPVGASAS